MENVSKVEKMTAEQLDALKAAEAKFRGVASLDVCSALHGATMSMTDAIADYLRTLTEAGFGEREAWNQCAKLLKTVEGEIRAAGRDGFKFPAEAKQRGRERAGFGPLRAAGGGRKKAEAAKIADLVADLVAPSEGDKAQADRPAEVTGAHVAASFREMIANWAKARDLADLKKARTELVEVLDAEIASREVHA